MAGTAVKSITSIITNRLWWSDAVQVYTIYQCDSLLYHLFTNGNTSFTPVCHASLVPDQGYIQTPFRGKFPPKKLQIPHEKLDMQKYRNYLLVTTDQRNRKLMVQLKDTSTYTTHFQAMNY